MTEPITEADVTRWDEDEDPEQHMSDEWAEDDDDES